MKRILKLRITRENLEKIAKGEKKSEYRTINDFYVERFCEKSPLSDGRRKIIQFDEVFLYLGNKENSDFVRCKCGKTWYHRFDETNLVEDYKVGDFVFKIELLDILEKNM